MRIAFLALVAVLVGAPAFAQRGSVSPDLSPEAAGEAFKQAVVDACVPAVTGSGVSGLSAAQRGSLQPTNDAATRKQAGAAPDETVWDVMDGKGVVTVREKESVCIVSVYGAPAKATIDGAERRRIWVVEVASMSACLARARSTVSTMAARWRA